MSNSANWKKQKIQLRRGAAAEWAARNTLLLPGEPGLETDTGYLKVGDGVTRWNQLAYWSAGGASPEDPRFTDSREWTAETISQAEAESGTSTERRAFTALRVFQAVAAWWAGSAAKTKLDGIASGATANASDADLRDRATHTGTQAISTVSGLQAALDGKQSTGFTTDIVTEGSTNLYYTDARAAAAAPVQSVSGRTGSILLTPADLSPDPTNAGNIGSGTLAYERLPVGSTTSTVCAGDDARLSDARLPTAHKASHATGGSDALTPSDIGAAPAASPTFTGVVSIPNGSVSSPSVTFTGDTDTGLYRSGTNSLSAACNGKELLRLNINGGSFLHSLVAAETATTAGFLGVPVVSAAQRAAAGYGSYFHGYHSGQNTGIFLGGYNADIGVLSCGMSLFSVSGLYPTGTVNYRSHRTDAVAIELNDGNFVIRQTSSGTADDATKGYVGVENVSFASEKGGSVAIMGVDPVPARPAAGTNPPSSHLYLLRDGSDSGTGPKLTFATRYTTSANYAANGYIQFQRTASAGISDEATTGHFVIASGARVGGVYTYVERIFVNGLTGALGVKAGGSASATAVYVGDDVNTGLFQEAGHSDTLSIATGGSERLRVNSSGNVGVGTTSPSALLDINSDTIRVRTAKTPASASDTGNAGDICWDADYVYICVSSNSWKRASLASW